MGALAAELGAGPGGRPISYGELEQRLGMELLPGVEIR